MRITIKWETGETANLVLVASAVSYLMDRPERPTAWLLYGDPPTIRIPIHRTKAGFSLEIQRIEPGEQM